MPHSPPQADPPIRPAAPPRRILLTAALWLASLGALAVGGLIATLFVMMPVSLDPGEMIAAGVDPWRDAAWAAGAFSLLFLASIAALLLWHRARGRAGALLAAWAITAVEVALVAWGGAGVVRDWF